MLKSINVQIYNTYSINASTIKFIVKLQFDTSLIKKLCCTKTFNSQAFLKTTKSRFLKVWERHEVEGMLLYMQNFCFSFRIYKEKKTMPKNLMIPGK